MGRHRDLGQEMRLDEIHGWKIFPMKKTMLLTYQFLDVPCVSSLEAEFDEMTGKKRLVWKCAGTQFDFPAKLHVSSE